MIDVNKKLEKLEKNCIEAAKKEKNSLEEKNDILLNEKLDEKINSYKDELKEKYVFQLNKLNREYNKNIFDYEMNEKKKVNVFYETLIKNIENKLKEEFKSFCNLPEYKEYLFTNIEFVLSKVSNNNCTIYVTENDYAKYKDEIVEKFNIANVDKTSNENIGGVILVNKVDKVSIDNTLKTNIEEKVRKIKIS